MSTQKYQRTYEYIHEYQRLVYDFYSKDVVAFLTTYYHIDTTNTIWDDENLMGGSYDRVGEYSGTRYSKILLLPVYYTTVLRRLHVCRNNFHCSFNFFDHSMLGKILFTRIPILQEILPSI